MISQEDRIKTIKDSLTFYKDFPKKGINFCDILPLLSDPAVLHQTVDALEAVLAGVEFDRIVGLESRGFLFGVPLAYKMNKSFVPIRKAGKLCGQVARVTYDLEYGTDTVEIQKSSIKPGDRIVLIDDVLATGGTMNAALKLTQEVKAEVVRIIFIADVPALHGNDKLNIEKSKIISLLHLE